MIFVTVGAQMPFDRLIGAIDEWARANPDEQVFAQIGETDFRPAHIEWATFLEPREFRRRIAEADFIVSHAGTGSIIAALSAAKPILLMPRHASKRETRNEHQLATVSRFKDRAGISVAMDEYELPDRLDHLAAIPAPEPLNPNASPRLLETIREFVHGA